MRVIIIGTERGAFEVVEIDGSLESLQEMVGGHIECCAPAELVEKGIQMLCNEEGLLKGLAPNENLYPFFYVGPCVMVATGGEKFLSLSDKQRDYILAWLYWNLDH